jgi:hypothetical protein
MKKAENDFSHIPGTIYERWHKGVTGYMSTFLVLLTTA